MGQRQRVKQNGLLAPGDLQQADLFAVAVKAVGLEIDSNLRLLGQFRRQGFDLFQRR